MPSPIAHLAGGYVVYRVVSKAEARHNLLLAACAFSLLADLDTLPAILLGRRWWTLHRQFTHSLLVGLTGGLLTGAVARFVFGGSFRLWLTVTSLSYASHLVLDCFTPSNGVMLFWPFEHRRFRSPIPLFYGFYWTRGLMTPHHVVTALTEGVFSALAWWATRRTDRC